MNPDLSAYVAQKGWTLKMKSGGREYVLADECPFCCRSGHVYFNADTAQWKCHRCGETGNLLTMKRRLGDLEERVLPPHLVYLGARDSRKPNELKAKKKPSPGLDKRLHENLLKSPRALAYLKEERAFTDETIERFCLGYADKGGNLLISIPYYYNSELVNIKFRTLPPNKEFRRIHGCASTLFNVDVLKDLPNLPAEDRRVIVCESETDAMALVQVGYTYVVASSAGANSWQSHWLEALELATEIVLFYDNDEAGEDGTVRASSFLGRYRCSRAYPTLHDAAEMMEVGCTYDDFQLCIQSAKQLEESSVKPSSAFAASLKARLASPTPRGRSTGWLSLDEVWGGIRDGELTIVTGDTSSGKSTWTTAAALQRLYQSEPVLIAPFEQRPDEVLGKLVSMVSGRSLYDLTQQEVDKALIEIDGLPLYWLDCYGSIALRSLKEAIYNAVRRKGVRFGVLDHLHFFLENDKPNEERFRIEEAVKEAKSWCLDLAIHLFLVVHPHQLGYDSRGRMRKPDLNNLKGSSEIKKIADNGVRVHRHRTEDREDKGEATITILKCRSGAGTEGSIKLVFDSDSETYYESIPSKTEGSSGRRPEGEFSEETWDIPR